jgi:hypothetical protein
MGRPGLLVSHRLFRSSPPRFFGSKWDFGRSFVYSSDGSKHRATSQQQHEQQRQQPGKLNWIIREDIIFFWLLNVEKTLENSRLQVIGDEFVVIVIEDWGSP